MKRTNKKLPIIIGVIVIAIIAIVGIIMVVGNKGHRVIKVDNVTGEASLERKANEQEIYENINLKSEDAVITGQDGQVELLVDSDKHILARENTKFKVVSKGDENKGKLKIELLYGTSLVEIENKLPEDAFFEVETPNATIGVRGTIFETSYYEEENKTVVVVTSGVVEVTSDDESVTVEEGQRVIVVDEEIEIVNDEMDSVTDNNSNTEEIDLPLEYSETIAFEAVYSISAKETGVYVKCLNGFWSYLETNYDIKDIRILKDSDLEIEYVVEKKDIVVFYNDFLLEYPDDYRVYRIETRQNVDGDIILCRVYKTTDYDEVRYEYIKKISEDMYLSVAVSGTENAEIFDETNIEKYLPLTMNCYYKYDSDLVVDTEMDIEVEPYYGE